MLIRESFEERTMNPFWIPLAFTLGAMLSRRKKRRHDEGMTKAWRIHVWYNDTEKYKNQGATFEKKSGNKWHPMTITITIDMRPLFTLSSQIARQTQWLSVIYFSAWSISEYSLQRFYILHFTCNVFWLLKALNNYK